MEDEATLVEFIKDWKPFGLTPIKAGSKFKAVFGNAHMAGGYVLYRLPRGKTYLRLAI